MFAHRELSENSGDNSQPSKFDLGSQYKLVIRFKATEPATFEADARPENLFVKVNDRLVYHPVSRIKKCFTIF